VKNYYEAKEKYDGYIKKYNKHTENLKGI